MKTVALVDWNWKGHHPTYFHKLIEGFLGTGVRVLALCPAESVEEVRRTMEGSNLLTVLPCRYYQARRRLPGFLRTREHARRVFGGLEQSFRTWERAEGAKIDLVFFSTIYDFEFETIGQAMPWFSRPWSGIYLHARAFRMPGTLMPFVNRLPCPEKIFTTSSMSSVCLIDEAAVTPMQALAKGKPAFEFPDITGTEIESPLDGESLAGKLLRFANGRKIVVCLGHLQKTKGLLELCKIANDPRASNICFFFGGEVNWSDLTPDEIRFIQTTWEQCSNVLTHLARLSDKTMNSLIQAADVIFAAYTNFPNSSNIMTKAALLERPLVVSDGYLMAERVRKYRLGAIAPEGSVEDIVKQIVHLCKHGGDPAANYQEYYAKHSPEALQAAVAKVVEAISTR
jgi:hypothetical protein